MYEIRVSDLATDHKEFQVVLDAVLERYNRLARHVPNGRLTYNREAPPRELYAASYTPIIMNHATAMVHAFRQGWYASGFALARPALEGLLKQALLTAYRGDDAGWQDLIDRRVKIDRNSLKDMGTRDGWPDLRQRWDSLAPVLNDFVHGGKGQVLSNPVDEDGWPVYPGEWFWTAMFIATFSMLATSGWLWAHIKDEERARAVLNDLSSESWGVITTARNSQTVRIVGSDSRMRSAGGTHPVRPHFCLSN